ncbi:hypothetical protein IWX90DRAFT_63610 [Phyllosticta citrichinensis]|uniref:Uncharacterized protein n=1 Tax=Phyllosticta citrichinensis TaxID=1130410 RepID=A0ABR1XHE4_9PEZI
MAIRGPTLVVMLETYNSNRMLSNRNDANFINFCEGDTLTNGAQNKTGSCNGIVMGKIPAQSQMVSAIIVNPKPGEDIEANQAFDIKVQTSNLKTGAFTNPQTTYYAAPQDLDGGGDVIGHAHVVIQDMGGTMTPSNTLDASKTTFFKSIDDAGNGDGLLSATVANGLPPGVYRVCTMNSASNHQPVVMPVAQRGSQDDCTKFTVGQVGSGCVMQSVSEADWLLGEECQQRRRWKRQGWAGKWSETKWSGQSTARRARANRSWQTQQPSRQECQVHPSSVFYSIALVERGVQWIQISSKLISSTSSKATTTPLLIITKQK